MAFTQADVDALKTALSGGLTSATIQGETVVYRSVSEMKQILKMMEADVAPGSVPKSLAVQVLTAGRGL